MVFWLGNIKCMFSQVLFYTMVCIIIWTQSHMLKSYLSRHMRSIVFFQESLLFIFVCNTCIALISPFKWHNRRTASCWSMMTNINNNVIDNISIVLWRFDFDMILFKIWFIWPYTIIYVLFILFGIIFLPI